MHPLQRRLDALESTHAAASATRAVVVVRSIYAPDRRITAAYLPGRQRLERDIDEGEDTFMRRAIAASGAAVVVPAKDPVAS